MHPAEEVTVRAFIVSNRQERWLLKLGSTRQRRSVLDRLNHCSDFDERYASPIPATTDRISLLRERGAPATCHVIADIAAIDGRELPLAEAIGEAERGGFGVLLCCVAGRLAYDQDERGSRRRLLLKRAD